MWLQEGVLRVGALGGRCECVAAVRSAENRALGGRCECVAAVRSAENRALGGRCECGCSKEC